MTDIEKASIAIGLVSLIGVIPVVQVWFEWISRLIPARLLVAFKNRSAVDIILTTSSYDASRLGASVVRATTGIGQVQGVSLLSRFLGAAYKRKKTYISISKSTSVRPDKDLILLGGPSKNEYSLRFLEKLVAEVPSLGLMVDDDASRIEVAGNTYDIGNLRIENGFPQKDIALVVVWKNPFASEPARAIYCAGMTSYGTSGAATWLFHDVLMSSGSRMRKLVQKVGLCSPSFLVVLEVDVVNGAVAAISEKLMISIPLQ
jgi:hypothetical protein